MGTVIISPISSQAKAGIPEAWHANQYLLSDQEVTVLQSPYHEKPRVIARSGGLTISLGNCLGASQLPEDWLVKNKSEKLKGLSALNGSFLHIVIGHDHLEVISDRFGSINLFFCFDTKAGLILSTDFRCVLDIASGLPSRKINEAALFEFVYMRRLFGCHTYLESVSKIPPGSLSEYEYQSRRFKAESYWKPDSHEITDHREMVSVLSQGLRDAVGMYLSDELRHGLMLSGGLDSRALLALGQSRYSTVTNTPSENNEFRVAEMLARQVGSDHELLIRPTDYLGLIFDSAMRASNGMTLFYEAQFLGYLDYLSSKFDAVHLGLGLDIFFCGHYMSKNLATMYGRPLCHFQQAPINEQNFVSDFCSRISYRQKVSDTSVLFDPEWSNEQQKQMKENLQQMSEEGEQLGFSDHRLWEYLHLSDFGRHYSMLMASSLRSKIDTRIPALENQLYQLAFSMSPALKLNWSVYIQALTSIAPDLMKVRNANTNIRASRSLHAQSIIRGARKLARGIGFSGLRGTPSYWDRSWPLVRDDFKCHVIESKIQEMLDTGVLPDLPFVRKNGLRQIIREHNSGQKDHAILLGQLLTLEYAYLRHF